MALFTEFDFDEFERQQNQLRQQQAAQRLLDAESNLGEVMAKKPGALESVLSGIGNALKNVKDTAVSMVGSGNAGIIDLVTGKAFNNDGDSYTDKFKDWEKKNTYGDENMSDADLYAKRSGKAFDAASTISDFIPVGAGVKAALNIGQGVVSGGAQSLIDKGSGASLEDAMRGALVGGASAGVGGAIGGKLANRVSGNNILSKAINSNVGRSAITGATAGGVGGGLAAAMDGGDVIQGALQGATTGGVGGAVTTGAMGLAGRGLGKLGNRLDRRAQIAQPEVETVPSSLDSTQSTTPSRRNIPITDYDAGELPVNVNVNSSRRNIPITDYDAGELPVNVRTINNNGDYTLAKNAGSTIDGVLGRSSGRNLSEVEAPHKYTFAEGAKKYFPGENVTTVGDVIGKMSDGENVAEYLKSMGKDPDIMSNRTYNTLREGAREAASFNNPEVLGLPSKSELPILNREQYYEDTLGRVNGNDQVSYKDVPDYMKNHLSNPKDAQEAFRRGDNDDILRELFNDDESSLSDLYRRYEEIAQSDNSNTIYTPENIDTGLYMMGDRGKIAEQDLADRLFGDRRGIDVKKSPSRTQNVEVRRGDNNIQEYPQTTYAQRTLNPNQGVQNPEYTDAIYRKQTISPRTPEQPQVQAMPEAEVVGTPIQRNTQLSLDPIQEAKLDRMYTVAKQRQGQALLNQYGTIDAPTARSVGDAGQVLTSLYDNYGLKTPAEVQYAAKKLTGADGAVTKLTRKLASSAGDIPAGYNVADLDRLIVESGLGLDSAKGKALKQQISSIIKSTKMVDDSLANANDVLDMVKKLERKSADVVGRSGDNYHRATSEDKAAASVLNAVAYDYKDRIWDNAQDISSVLTKDAISELKAIFPDNKNYQNGVDNIIAKATNGQELRHAMADLVNGSKIANNSKMISGTAGAQMVKAATSANPIVAGAQMLAINALDSDTANRIRADRYARQASRAQNKLTGKTGRISNITDGIKGKVSDIAGALNDETLYDKGYAAAIGATNPLGNVMSNQITRQAGLSAMRDYNTDKEIQEAQQQFENAQADYGNVVSQAQADYANAMQAQAQASQSDSQLGRIANAMEQALTAGDIDSYGKLADLYQEAAKIYQLQNPTATKKTKELSSNQSKAITGLQQVQALSEMQPGVRTALANSPLGGLVDLTGGDDYANQARSLALTLGYLQSGANITPREAENIGRAYVPKAVDSDKVRQQKLSRAEQLLRNYLSDTGSLQGLM